MVIFLDHRPVARRTMRISSFKKDILHPACRLFAKRISLKRFSSPLIHQSANMAIKTAKQGEAKVKIKEPHSNLLKRTNFYSAFQQNSANDASALQKNLQTYAPIRRFMNINSSEMRANFLFAHKRKDYRCPRFLFRSIKYKNVTPRDYPCHHTPRNHHQIEEIP